MVSTLINNFINITISETLGEFNDLIGGRLC